LTEPGTTPNRRPAVPASLERELKVEAGHRCAIPACRQVPVELAHIEPWSEVRQHSFENMIALCPTCHTRFDRGDIDRRSMRIYKANLTIINSRYGDLEKRVIEAFARNPNGNIIELPGSLNMLLMYLIQDGLLEVMRQQNTVAIAAAGGTGAVVSPIRYRLTPRGREFVQRWANADEIE
jgi:hypothetical protein